MSMCMTSQRPVNQCAHLTHLVRNSRAQVILARFDKAARYQVAYAAQMIKTCAEKINVKMDISANLHLLCPCGYFLCS